MRQFPFQVPCAIYPGFKNFDFEKQEATLLRQVYIASLKNWSSQNRLHESLDWRIFLAPMVDIKFAELYVMSLIADISRHKDSGHMHRTWSCLRTGLDTTASTKEGWQRIWHEPRNDSPPFLIDHQFVMEFARKLEVLIRDEQQLEVGRLSLQESKKAIEQANISIQEGKRVKMREYRQANVFRIKLTTDNCYSNNTRFIFCTCISINIGVWHESARAWKPPSLDLWGHHIGYFRWSLFIMGCSLPIQPCHSFTKSRDKRGSVCQGQVRSVRLAYTAISCNIFVSIWYMALFTHRWRIWLFTRMQLLCCGVGGPNPHDANRPWDYIKWHRHSYIDGLHAEVHGFRGINLNQM